MGSSLTDDFLLRFPTSAAPDTGALLRRRDANFSRISLLSDLDDGFIATKESLE